ncbi:calcium-transporting ATPase 12, plasma membrane-type [Manihot esculenta]|uniref:Calcium-transporting ATPase n=1 Tax=Manihot esculenta TaxID=3983 RepID=A0A2C9VB41_MANES|nr:calcium-transporting ATPase 12, plasma membrane-type [Manihot esculenta]OAY42126.1 hypothetical protein MANES_09G155100v8 [Manihot esculenta]
MPLRAQKHDHRSGLDTQHIFPAKLRWRMAVAAINFTRLLSLSKKASCDQTELLPSVSHVAILLDHDNIRTDDNVPLTITDQNILLQMLKEKNHQCLNQIGGVAQVAVILGSDVMKGIKGSEADVAYRRDAFGANKFKKPSAKSFLSFVLEALKETATIILLACAILSMAFDIKHHGLKDGWYDGGSNIVATFLVVVISAVSNFKQSRQFLKLSDEGSDIKVQVVRDGRYQNISIFDVVVGDLVALKIGDQIPADGLFSDGYSLKVDESSMTGESDHVEVKDTSNPFLFSGTKVADGFGLMIVTSVGMSTAWGDMISSISRNLEERTPLQARLCKLKSDIGKVGWVAAILVLVVLVFRYFTGTIRDDHGRREYNGSETKINDVLNSVVDIIATALTIVDVAIPEGLPLAVTLTLAYSMKQMMADNTLLRKLSALETMGSATTICTLTMEQIQVSEFWLGKELSEHRVSVEIEPEFYLLLEEGVAFNTTATVYKPHPTSIPEISGNPTDKAILSWAVLELGMNINETKQKCEIMYVEAFCSEKKRSGVMIRKSNERAIHTHWKGAAEKILAMCSTYYVKGGELDMNEEERMQFRAIIHSMAAKSLRCIAFAHKKIIEENGQVPEKLEETGFTLLGLIGLNDPCRPGTRTAVESCKQAKVSVKMITGDNPHVARAIAIECGILNPEEDNEKAVVEGVGFRNYSAEERMARIEDIRVMARSSPSDKLLMVECLKEKGHVVAVTGDGMNDAAALKVADVGLCMGTQGTEVAKESSDIIILDDNFTSVATVLRWGRCIHNNIKSFIQFQLTVNVVALVVNFVAAISSGKVPLTAVQLLWVNLIVDTMGALAFATEQPTDELMTKSPPVRSDPLITKIMWRNLIAQALYQVVILMILQFKGATIFDVDEKVKSTLIFNTFVLCQVFNEFNARKLEKWNIINGIHKNKLFLAIIGITVVLQVMMVELLKTFARTERLSWGQWGFCIGIAAASWPISCAVKCIPVLEFVFNAAK